MTIAHDLKDYVRGLVAWNMPLQFKARLIRTSRNQYGTTYEFVDRSRAFVPKGCSQPIDN